MGTFILILELARERAFLLHMLLRWTGFSCRSLLGRMLVASVFW